MSPKGWTRIDSGAARYGDVRAGRATGDGVGDDVITIGALLGAEVTIGALLGAVVATGALLGAEVTMGALLGADVAMGALLGDDVSGGDDDAIMHVTDATALQPPRWFPGPVLGGQSLLLLQMLP